MKKLFSLFVVVFATICLWAHDFEVDGIYYNYRSGNHVEVTYKGSDYSSYYDEYSGDVIIPSTVTYSGTTYSVTSVGHEAFRSCGSLTSVVMPNSIVKLGGGVFYYCGNLKSVTLSANITSLPTYVVTYDDDPDELFGFFANCYSLESIVIPEGVTTIGDMAFKSCTSLKEIILPNTVTNLGKAAFYNCSKLRSVTLSENITSLQSAYYVAYWDEVYYVSGCFSACSSLESIRLPKSITRLEKETFYGCNSLKSVHVESTNPPQLEDDVFSSSLVCYVPCETREIYEQSSWAQYADKFIEEGDCPVDPTWQITYTSSDGNIVTPYNSNAFGANIVSNTYENGVGTITFDGPVTSIGNMAFYRCSRLTSISIPNSVTSIGRFAFYSCSSLESIDLPEGVSHIGIEAFAYSGIKSITIPTTLKRIEEQAFNRCNSLAKTIHTGDIASWCSIVFDGAVSNPMFQSHNLYLNNQEVIDLVIPNTVDTIKDNAFCYGTKFKSITIPNSVISIGNEAFGDCWEIETINWGQNIEHIGGAAFNNCSKLTSITLPESLITIGSTAFWACKKLISVVIPKNVTQIGNNAFEYCYSLESITCEAVEPPTIAEYTFNTVSKSIPVYVPCGSVETYKVAPLWNNFGNIQEPLAEYSIVVEVNDNTMGIAQVDYNSACGCQISAIPNAGYRFVEWSDGNIDNPRSLELSENTSLVANFEIIYLTPETATICYGDTYQWHDRIYDATGTYYDTLSTGLATLHLTVLPAVEETIHNVSICQGNTYTWQVDGQVYSESGNYSITLQNVNGCDSVVTLNLIVNPIATMEEAITACDSYDWNGQTYTSSGDYTYTTTAKNGCDSIVTLHLTIYNSEIGETEHATICYGETYTWNGRTYSAEGEYSVTLSNTLGCDSVATLHLTIMPEAVTTTETVVVGSEEVPYTWRGNTYSSTGRYRDVEQYTIVACDSAIYVLDLTVLSTGNYDEQSVTICETEAPYTWYGESYSVTGKYTYTEKYSGTDIDSVQHILNLTVNPTLYTEEHVTACDSYEWNGLIYTESGDYDYMTTATTGCDSIVTLHLTINKSEYVEESVVACDSYTWNGATYTESGDYTYTTTTGRGCERVEVLHLTVNKSEYVEEMVTACDSYEWNGVVYTESGEYTYTTTATNGCDSLVTLHLTINKSEVGATEYNTICYGETFTWNGQTYTASGEYSVVLTNVNGCDSTATLHLTIMPQAVTTTETIVLGSDEVPYTWRGNTYSATGRYTDVVQYAAVACDSAIYVLDLTVLSTGNYDEQSVTICETEAPYTWYGESYSVTGKYTYTEKYSGTDIDSVQHILNLTVNPTIYTEEHVTACDSYEWNGLIYTESGDYDYTTTATTGCDSIVTLHLTINKSEYVEVSVVACDSYVWNGVTYTESGDYTYTTTTDAGCERVEVLHLTINKSEYVEFTETACDSYEWNGLTYTQSGDYTYTTTAATGCDSIVTLHLTINKSEHVEFTEVACDSYEWNSVVYTESGDYTYTTTTDQGCERVEVLHLTINKSEYVEETVAVCDEYVWNGVTYTESGDYTYNTTTAAGCERVEVLHLTINKSEREEYTEVACDEYVWNGVTYTESGDYSYNTTTAAGCERVEVLHLTINKSEHVEFTETACDEYVWNGVTYTESGDYTYTTTTAAGCERVEVLHLTINKSEHVEFTETACDSYVWNGVTYTESGDYTYTTTTDAGCERVEVLHLTINKSEHVEFTETACDEYVWNGVTYTESGDYTYTTTTAAGCERVEVLHLTILPEAVTESEELALCPSELPYEWYGQSIIEAGTYSVTEPYAGMECDSVIHEVTVNVYVHTLPATVTQPIVRTGEAIDVTIPTAEIQAHIAAETWYAPNAEVAWYIMENSDWAALTTDPVAAGTKQVVLKYAVETDCGNIESDNMVIDVIPTSVENTDNQSPISNCQKVLYEDHIYILRDGKTYTVMGAEVK